MFRKTVFIAFAAAFVLAAAFFVNGALAKSSCKVRAGNPVQKLLKCVTIEGVRSHQKAFQAIADANGGTRVSGTSGYVESVNYVAGKLTEAGYHVTIQPFEYFAWFVLGPSTLQQTAPGVVVYVEEVDYTLMDQTEAGDVTAAVTAVDLQLGLGNSSTSGCEAADFAGFPAGNIALLQRGTCSFQIKAENAAAAGAVGAIIFNQGNTPGRVALFGGTLSAAYTGGIPVMSTSYTQGEVWAGTAGLVLRMSVDTFRGLATSYNVLADSTTGRSDNVVIAGAHLDSVSAGAGINDNGSGSAALLEVALQMKKVQPRNLVRFAFWGAEESGLIGSDYYVYNLTDAERDDIALYLNFDMVGSPNYVRFVYDGDGSAFGLPGPDGSGAIEALFANFYGSLGLASDETEISFRSDYAAFFDFGIPFGGLFTGAEGVKTAEQAAVYGGTAGISYDPCYHQACDSLDNVSLEVLDLNADAIAYSVWTYGMSTQSVNGVKGKARTAEMPDAENRGQKNVR